jgi:hypothetical protein
MFMKMGLAFQRSASAVNKARSDLVMRLHALMFFPA